MSPSELKRHVATLTRVLGSVNPTQADNARMIARHATDLDELEEWLSEEGGLGESVWTTVEEVLEAVASVSVEGSRRSQDCRVALRAIESITSGFLYRLPTRPATMLPPERPSLRVLPGGLSPQQQRTIVASEDGQHVAGFAALSIVRTDTIPAPSGKRSA